MKKNAKNESSKAKVVNWKKYCYTAKYKKAFAKDMECDRLRIRMAKLGYMQLVLAKFEFDENGNNVVDKLQFARYEDKAPFEKPLMFSSWKEVCLFIDGEEKAKRMMGY